MASQSNTGYLPIFTLIELLILISLAKGKLHGLGIVQFVAELTNNRVILSAATLYTALKRMYRERCIEETNHIDPDAKGNSERRKYYALTHKGRQVVANDVEQLDYLVSQFKAILQETAQANDNHDLISVPANAAHSPGRPPGR